MKALTILCAAVLSICSAAFASANDIITVHFSTPVIVGETTLPAGEVTINVAHGTGNSMLTFRSESGVSVTALVNRINDVVQRRDEPTIDLTRNGEAFRVERVWLADGSGFALLPLDK